MTNPQSTAQEIIEKYKEISCGHEHGEYDFYWSDELQLQNAKSCAIIHVNGIIESQPPSCNECGGGDKQFWEEVLNEIQSV